MFEALLFVALAITAIGILIAYDGSRDVFHPLFFIGPMLAFLYGWMPLQLLRSGSLFQYFDLNQLEFVQGLNVLGILAFVLACLAAGCRVRQPRSLPPKLSSVGCRRLRIGALAVGSMGLVCWLISIVNVGGFVNAFSKSYAGGWDDSGYVRDGNLLLLVGVLLAFGAIGSEGLRLPNLAIAALLGCPGLHKPCSPRAGAQRLLSPFWFSWVRI